MDNSHVRDFNGEAPPQTGAADRQGQEIRQARPDYPQGQMISPVHPANQWGTAQFWGYVILLSEMTKEDLAERGQSDLAWMVQDRVLERVLKDSCPAGNA